MSCIMCGGSIRPGCQSFYHCRSNVWNICISQGGMYPIVSHKSLLYCYPIFSVLVLSDEASAGGDIVFFALALFFGCFVLLFFHFWGITSEIELNCHSQQLQLPYATVHVPVFLLVPCYSIFQIVSKIFGECWWPLSGSTLT